MKLAHLQVRRASADDALETGRDRRQDPCYLVTGEYDPEVHRQALDAACWEGKVTPIVQAIRGLPAPEWRDEQPRLRLVR